jgi:hypothetical protein
MLVGSNPFVNSKINLGELTLNWDGKKGILEWFE